MSKRCNCSLTSLKNTQLKSNGNKWKQWQQEKLQIVRNLKKDLSHNLDIVVGHMGTDAVVVHLFEEGTGVEVEVVEVATRSEEETHIVGETVAVEAVEVVKVVDTEEAEDKEEGVVAVEATENY